MKLKDEVSMESDNLSTSEFQRKQSTSLNNSKGDVLKDYLVITGKWKAR
jgi:hypothetical protein